MTRLNRRWIAVNFALIVTTQILSLLASVSAAQLNGFSLDTTSIPRNEILRGGPPRDGIPALLSPNFIEKTAEQAPLKPDDVVLGLFLNGIAKAYPINIMNWHEIVNDEFEGKPVMISYCPLCGSGVAFERAIAKNEASATPALSFGVSGLLYNSDMLMYDHQTESLWSQIKGEAISGKHLGMRLQQLPMQMMRWKHWYARHPNTLVLSTQTGFSRNYDVNPYAGYESHERLYFPVSETVPDRYHAKAWVYGLTLENQSLAIPLSTLKSKQETEFSYTLDDQIIDFIWQPESESLLAYDQQGHPLPLTPLYWFAWYTFYPATLVYE
ncbi:DUF3179 domain-containing protein [Thaumasiovibrio subtropicus]|uniref:DUF3179 domain-containing protein n=1 Tax=Thaumasiovibrio subtropicus TaxID=1891207 RepID=UPI000B34F007|nr:DUF3179 domain-containing protein [Thaumasiovibrio subtropicus]